MTGKRRVRRRSGDRRRPCRYRQRLPVASRHAGAEPGHTGGTPGERRHLGSVFRYPGIRSDSDMYTYSYGFKPWTAKSAIADGDTILKYIRETAEEYGLNQHIRYNHKVVSAHWSSEDNLWTVTVARSPSARQR